MAQGATLTAARPSRFWLYAPFALLAFAAIAWGVAWFVIRGRIADGLDVFIAREAASGRQWTCADRSVSGFPFRIEVACSSLSVRDEDAFLSVGPVRSVAQVYQPRHVILEIAGPLAAGDGRTKVAGEWRLLGLSIHSARGGVQRASLAVDDPKVSVTGDGLAEPVTGASRRFELHLRQNAARSTEGALDVAASARGLVFPPLDALVGGTEPADVQIDLTMTQAAGFADGADLDDVDRWREAGGGIDLLLLSVTKGARAIQAKGSVRLDEAHRPAGQLDLSGAGLETLISNLTGGRGGMVSALLGQGRRPIQGGMASAPARLAPLPPIRMEDGRIALGPIPVPGVRIPPLY